MISEIRDKLYNADHQVQLDKSRLLKATLGLDGKVKIYINEELVADIVFTGKAKNFSNKLFS